MPETPFAEKVLGVGALFGGPDSADAWAGCLSEMVTRVDELQGEPLARFWVHVIFHFSGEFDSVSFSGVKTGRYAKSDGSLSVKIAVPEDLTPSAEALAKFFPLVAERVQEWSAKRSEFGIPAGKSIALLNLAAGVFK